MLFQELHDATNATISPRRLGEIHVSDVQTPARLVVVFECNSDNHTEADDCHQNGGGAGRDGDLMMFHPTAGADRKGVLADADRLVGEEALHVVGQVGGGAVSVVALKGHRFERDRGQRDVYAGVHRARVRSWLACDSFAQRPQIFSRLRDMRRAAG